MKLRLLALLATAGVAAAVVPGQAATVPASRPQITDAPGDANGVNDQGSGAATLNFSGPADDANADITSVVFATKFKTVTTTKKVTTVVKKKKVTKLVTVTTQVPDGFTVTMNLSAAPDGNHAYDVVANNPACAAGYFDFTFNTGPLSLNQIDCFPNDATSTNSSTVAGEAAVVGKSVVWTVPAGAVPNGSVFSALAGTTTTAALIGQIDQADGGTSVYKVGS
jgi:hypothetical protein